MDPLSSSSTPVVKHKRHKSRLSAFPDTDNIIDKVVVSQILNRLRTQLVSSTSRLDVDVLQQPVTREFITAQFLVESEVALCPVATKKLRDVLSSIRFDRLLEEEPPFTVADALKFDADGFPLLAPETIAVLDELSHRVVVGKDQIREVLEKDPILIGGGMAGRGAAAASSAAAAAADDPHALSDALDAVFPFETRVTPGALLADFVTKVQRPVHKVRFSKPFVHDVVHSMRSLGTSLPYVALILVFYILVAQLDLWGKFASYLNASTPNEPWSNFCEGGGVVNGSCFFHKRLIDDTVSTEETARFVRHEIVADLWKYAAEAGKRNHSNTSRVGAGDVPFEGSWLVGALIMRVAPPRLRAGTSEANAVQPYVAWSCESLNLSVGFFEPRLGLTYDCSAYSAVVIPFSVALEEALALSATFNLSAPAFLDAGMLIQYAMYAPSTGDVTWVTLSIAMPKYGGFVQKVQLEVLVESVHDLIVVAFWFSLVIWILDVLSLIVFRNVGIGLTHNLGTFAFRSFLLGLIAASYYHQYQSTIPNLLTIDYVPVGIDAAVGSSSFAVQLFALWALFLLALIVQFIAYLDGLKIIATLFSRIVPDVTGLLLVFGFLYAMFVMVSVILFGQTMAEYSSFYNANLQLLQYFLLTFDLKRLTENYPQIGFAFYFVFRVFIFYLVLNFFIVTIIAPIRSVWLEGDLPIAVNNVLAAKRQTAFLGGLRATLERYAIMTVDLLVGFIPITMPFWLKAAKSLEDLYEPLSDVEPFLDACAFLLVLRTTTAASAQRYRTARAATLPGLPLANYDASYHVCLLLLLAESNVSLLRDARSMRLLAAFDEFTTQTESGLNPPEDEKEVVLPPPDDCDADSTDETDCDDDSAVVDHSDDEEVHESNSGASNDQQHTVAVGDDAKGKTTTTTAESKSSRNAGEAYRKTHRSGDNAADGANDDAMLASQHAERKDAVQQWKHRVSFEITGGEDDENNNNNNNNGGGSSAQNDQDEEGDDPHFHFTRFLLQEICDHRFFSDGFYVFFTLVDRCGIVVMFALMLFYVNSMPRDIAYFSRNAHSGIRDLPYHQNCFDENCTNAFTKKWTYRDNLRLDHLQMFVERRLARSLTRQFSASSSSASSEGAESVVPDLSGTGEAVSWNSYIVVEWPIYVRQLRAGSTNCVVPPLLSESVGSSQEALRQWQIASSKLCGTLQLQTSFSSNATLERPSDSLLSPSAYIYRESGCPEIDKNPIYGVRYPSIPCQGFTAEIANVSQLEYAVRHWIDGLTRFVGITFTLRHRRPVVAAAAAAAPGIAVNETRLEYACYTELSEGGSAGRFFTRTTTYEDEALDAVNRKGLRLMVADFVLGTLQVLIPVLHCLYHRRWQKLAQQYFFSFRMSVFVVYLAIAIIDSNDVFVHWPKQAEAVILIVWLFMEMLFSVVFPFSQFFFRRVIIVDQFIRLTVLKVVLLLPVFAIILSAFSLSGYLLWGGSLEAFSTIHGSFRTTSLGLLGDFNFYELYDVSPTLSVGFTVLFLITVIILLLNILLAVIAGCADESREESQVIAPLEVIGHVMSRRVYFGPLIGVLLIFLLKEKQQHPHKQRERNEEGGAGGGEAHTPHAKGWQEIRNSIGSARVGGLRHDTGACGRGAAGVESATNANDAALLLVGQSALEMSLPGSLAGSTVPHPELLNAASGDPLLLTSELALATPQLPAPPLMPQDEAARSAAPVMAAAPPLALGRPVEETSAAAVPNPTLTPRQSTRRGLRGGAGIAEPQTPLSNPKSPSSLYHRRRQSTAHFGNAANDDDNDDNNTAVHYAAAGEDEHQGGGGGKGALSSAHSSSMRRVVDRMFVVRRHDQKLEVPRFHVLENHRIPTPLECLLPRLGPALVSEVCHALHLASRPEYMQCSLVAYILTVHQHFQVVHPGLHALDIVQDEEEQIQVLGAFHLEKAQRYALQRKSLSMSHSGGTGRSPRPSIVEGDAIHVPARSGVSGQLFGVNNSGVGRSGRGQTTTGDFLHAAVASAAESMQLPRRDSLPISHPVQVPHSTLRRSSRDGADGASASQGASALATREAQKAANTWKRFAKRGIGRIAAFDGLLAAAVDDEYDEVQAIARTMSMASRRQSFTRGAAATSERSAAGLDSAVRASRGGSFTRRTSGTSPTLDRRASGDANPSAPTDLQQPSEGAKVDA